MRALPSADRKRLESAVLAARRASESACRAAIDNLGVFATKRPEHLDAGGAALRNGLRAKWRQLEDDNELLISECAYEQWHRLLFARFLAENNLLLHPQYEVPVTLGECAELATELGEPDAWSVAARFASEILPGIFRLDDPCVRLRLAPEGRHALERILDGVAAEVFLADDGLGWVYQYWQKDKKDEINASERKIGGADLGPVTQLFTENYMVRFLLENSLGAWWATRHPESPLVKDFEYLRFDEEGKPAAGSFGGWPQRVAEVTVMDPCCGSGHFLVEAFSMLWQMRVEEDGISPIEAQDAVLRDNLFGLEIDSRCVQIAMFTVALHTWKSSGYRNIATLNVACSGISTAGQLEEWIRFASNDERIETALTQLHSLFKNSQTIGSLLNAERATNHGTLHDIDHDIVAPFAIAALGAAATEVTSTVHGLALNEAAEAYTLLARKYTLVVTNVPYLARGSQSEALREYSKRFFPTACGDLATTFVARALEMTEPDGHVAVVSPAAWLFLGSFEEFRRELLVGHPPTLIAWLGTGAFTAISGGVVNVTLAVISNRKEATSRIYKIDASEATGQAKSALIAAASPVVELNSSIVSNTGNPAARIVPSIIERSPLLAEFVQPHQGLATGDLARFGRNWWEVPGLDGDWIPFLGGVRSSIPYGGRSSALYWQHGHGHLHAFNDQHKAVRKNTHKRGVNAWGKRGILVSQMSLGATIYLGEHYDDTTTVLIPNDETLLPALWSYLSSDEYPRAVRRIDQSLKVPAATLAKVPFEVERWREQAMIDGDLPTPWSDDSTQWLFQGHPGVATSTLQVAIGRLLGFRWPRQAESDEISVFADNDGIVCLAAVAGEARAADRLQQLLAVAYADVWSPAKLKKMLEESGSKKRKLTDWLHDDFFKQHCALFENRPFIWHVWDGLRDGFSALANYHMLDRKTLAKLTYSYLGQDWVERQRADLRDEVAGAEARLVAALELKRKLELILEGEQPYDIYVRWKEPHEQAIGWEPDLDDGVRLNIRPFVTAGVLRAQFNVHWNKDRGKNPDGSERLNDIHLSLAAKEEARKRAGRT